MCVNLAKHIQQHNMNHFQNYIPPAQVFKYNATARKTKNTVNKRTQQYNNTMIILTFMCISISISRADYHLLTTI